MRELFFAVAVCSGVYAQTFEVASIKVLPPPDEAGPRGISGAACGERVDDDDDGREGTDAAVEGHDGAVCEHVVVSGDQAGERRDGAEGRVRFYDLVVAGVGAGVGRGGMGA